jgi:hypothetical protein
VASLIIGSCSENQLLQTQAVEGWAKLLLNDAIDNDKVRHR